MQLGGIIPVVLPLLQLAPAAHLVGRQPVSQALHPIVEVVLDAQGPRAFQQVGEQVPYDLLVVGYPVLAWAVLCLLYTSPSPRDVEESRMPSSA